MTSTPNEPATVRPFTLDIDQADLDDLDRRLATARLPRRRPDHRPLAGDVDPDLFERLLQRWRDGFDWRATEARVNTMPQVVVTLPDGQQVHAVHARAQRPTGTPVLLLHGWPDTFLRYREVVPLLLAAGHDVVVPSLPGFAFSDQPERATLESAATAVHAVAVALGHERYAVHGGDWGSGVADALATAYPEAVVALHLSDVPFSKVFTVDSATTTGAERAFLEAGEAWGEQAVYFSVAAAQPLALAYGLADSPAGLLAWFGEKYVAWSDRVPSSDSELDVVLAQVALVWLSGTAFSSMRYYAEALGGSEGGWGDDQGAAAGGWGDDQEDDGGWGAPEPLPVPTGFALFPADIGVPPREHAARFYDVRRFSLMPRGGHYGAQEEPEALAADLVAFLAEVAP